MPGYKSTLNRHPDIVERDLRDEFDATIKDRVERYIDVDHPWVVPKSHFAEASQEAVKLYRDGHFISCIMVTQAVNEALLRLVLKANSLKRADQEDTPTLTERLQTLGLITPACAQAIYHIWHSFRNDFHHMNEKIASLDLQSLAKRNIINLSLIEGELFACDRDARGIVPINRQYWTFNGKVIPVFLRLS